MMLLLRPSLAFVPSWDTALRLPWEAGLVDWVVRGHMEENGGASAAAPTTSHTIEDLEPSRIANLLINAMQE